MGLMKALDQWRKLREGNLGIGSSGLPQGGEHGGKILQSQEYGLTKKGYHHDYH